MRGSHLPHAACRMPHARDGAGGVWDEQYEKVYSIFMALLTSFSFYYVSEKGLNVLLPQGTMDQEGNSSYPTF